MGAGGGGNFEIGYAIYASVMELLKGTGVPPIPPEPRPGCRIRARFWGKNPEFSWRSWDSLLTDRQTDRGQAASAACPPRAGNPQPVGGRLRAPPLRGVEPRTDFQRYSPEIFCWVVGGEPRKYFRKYSPKIFSWSCGVVGGGPRKYFLGRRPAGRSPVGPSSAPNFPIQAAKFRFLKTGGWAPGGAEILKLDTRFTHL